MKRIKKITAMLIISIFMLSPFHFALATPVAPIAPESPEPAAAAPIAPVPAAADQEEAVIREPQPISIEALEDNPNANQDPAAITSTTLAEEQKDGPNQTATTEEDGESDVSSANTGSNSGKESTDDPESITEINNDNTATVDNNITAKADSGSNDASYNTGNGTVETGEANLAVSLLNMINTNITALGDGLVVYILKNILNGLVGDYIIDPGADNAETVNGDITVGNDNTGANSENSATLAAINRLLIENNNEGEINNNLDLTSSTGNNNASYNTGNGTISTGDSNLSLSIVNFLNSNFIVTDTGIIAVINVFGDWLGDLLLPANYTLQNGETVSSQVTVNNFNTGADSTNTASLTGSDTVDIDNNNEADVQNNIDVAANTGGNMAGYNTGSGTVGAGTSSVGVEINNDGNRNIFADLLLYLTVNVLGSWTGEILLPSSVGQTSGGAGPGIEVSNENTGAGSENSAELEMENETEVDNDNEAKINNNIKLFSNTGQNSASYNTGNGSISTGNAKVLLNILNVFNQNIFAGRAIYLFVNVFGDWVGNVDIVDNTVNNEGVDGGSPGKQVVNPSKNKVKNLIVNEVTGGRFDVEVDNAEGEDHDRVLGAAYTGGDDSAVNSIVNESKETEPTFWQKNMGRISGALFIVYLLILTIAAHRKKQREELFKEFV